MNTLVSFALACALSTTALGVGAQQSEPAPRPARAASAPPPIVIGPRPMSPSEKGESASPAGDLRPERPVTPQINIPLGKKPAPPSKPAVRSTSTRGIAASGGIDDAAARCEAQASDPMRAKCRAKPPQDPR